MSDNLYQCFYIHSQGILTTQEFVFQVIVCLGDHFCPQGHTLVFLLEIGTFLFRAFEFAFEAVSDGLEISDDCASLDQNIFGIVDNRPINFVEDVGNIAYYFGYFDLILLNLNQLVLWKVDILRGDP